MFNRIILLTWSCVLLLSCKNVHALDDSEESVFTQSENATFEENCVLGVISKIYINPEKILCDGHSCYLLLSANERFPLVDLQKDQNGYFVVINSHNHEYNPLLEYAFNTEVTRPCPLCETEGYIAGMCKNEECPAIQNRKNYDEERARKKEAYKKKKQQEKN